MDEKKALFDITREFRAVAAGARCEQYIHVIIQSDSLRAWLAAGRRLKAAAELVALLSLDATWFV